MFSPSINLRRGEDVLFRGLNILKSAFRSICIYFAEGRMYLNYFEALAFVSFLCALPELTFCLEMFIEMQNRLKA